MIGSFQALGLSLAPVLVSTKNCIDLRRSCKHWFARCGTVIGRQTRRLGVRLSGPMSAGWQNPEA